ncbi:MAG: hypothetical protein WCW13_04180 [archaeon]|jgi:hypothetical protein
MFEEIIFVLLVLIVMVGVFGYSSYRDRRTVKEAELAAVSAKEKIHIAERKFMQGKIRKPVFELILDELEEELISAELVLFRFKKRGSFSVEDKVLEVVAKLDKPTKHRRALVEKILISAELIRQEVSLLEGKLMKHEIKQSVFEKLIKDKEHELIRKEKELTDIVIKSADLKN